MPQSTPERRARWKDDETAIKYLERRGFKLTGSWCWTMPSPDHEFSEKDKDAIIYLIEEWDYGPALGTTENSTVYCKACDGEPGYINHACGRKS